jgi:hypothetical protein
MFCCIYYRQAVLHFETRSMLRFELVMMHVYDGCLLQFYMTFTSPDTIWIMFKKGLVLYLPKS